jgi:hypothetical protein
LAAARLGADIGATQVWVTDVLGESSTDTESDARLHELAMLDCQGYGTAVL